MHVQERWNRSKINYAANRLTTVLFIVYLLVLLWILLFKLGVQFSYMEKRSVNLVPFKEALTSHGKIDVSETILNVLIFIPLGIYAGILSRGWNFGIKLLFFVFISLIVEALQYILAIGAFDMTDVSTNTIGGIMGWMIFKVIEKILNDNGKTQKFINTVALVGTVLIVSFLLMLQLKMLPIRYQ